MITKEYEITIKVVLKYDEKEIKETLEGYKEMIYPDATEESMLQDAAVAIAMGHLFPEVIGKIYPCVTRKYALKEDINTSAICYEDREFWDIEGVTSNDVSIYE